MSEETANVAETPVVEAIETPVVEKDGVDTIQDTNLEPALSQEPPTVEGATTEEVAELQEEVKEAVEEGATEAEIENMVREFEIKVNGKKKTIKVDLNNTEELIRKFQMAEAGQSAMQDKAELEKLVNQELMRAKSDPWEFLKDLGLNPDDLAEQRVVDKIEQMKKSPEQVEREKIQQELKEARAKLEVVQKEKEDARLVQMQDKIAVEFDKELTDALQSDPELPKTRKTVARIADAMLWAMENGFQDAKVADVIPSVKAEIQNEMNEFMSDMSEDLMEKYIGKKNIERLRNQRLAKMKAAPKMDIKPVAKEVEAKEEDKVSMKDYFRNLGKV